MHLKREVVKKAKEHGFDLCHVSPPAFADKHRHGLDAWVGEGMQGQMTYMSEPDRLQRRKQPQSMLDGVKSVISVGMRHSPPPYSPDQAGARHGSGIIAAYAHGHDYHDIMKKRLKALARELDRLLGQHDQRVFVDTAPVLEHALAETGGLGWQGKHTLTINQQLGSWLMLGEIFTTANLEPDTPASFHCGSCTACIDICPTGAIVGPFVVDAQRCISYLTIEYRGFIPHGLRRQMGNRIFGCDDCQSICPWNRHVVAPVSDFLTPRGENILPDLASLLGLDEMAFRLRFSKSPVKRAGRAGLLRNVCIAMGNSGDPAFIPLLLKAMDDEAAEIRGHAAWALGELSDIGSARLIGQHLMAAEMRETSAESLKEIKLSMDRIRMKHAIT